MRATRTIRSLTALLVLLLATRLYATTAVFTGNAPAVAQVNTITPASVTVGNIFTITINGKTVNYTSTGGTVADVTAGLVAALNSVSVPPSPEFSEVTWTDNTTTITGKSKVAGVPFTQTSSAATGAGSAGMTLVTSTTTASSGPNDWAIAKNWSTGSVPGTGDAVTFENSNISVLWNLSQNFAFTVFTVNPSYTGDIGLPEYNPIGYREYRTTYFTPATITTLNYSGTGSRGKIKNVDGTANVSGTGQSKEAGVPSLLLTGIQPSSNVNITKGSVGISFFQGETSTADNVRIGYLTNAETDSNVTFGTGLTVTNVFMTGGALSTKCGISAVTISGPGTITQTNNSIATLTNYAGKAYFLNSAVCVAYIGGSGSLVDFSRSVTPKTVTDCTITKGAALLDPGGIVTFTNGIIFDNCRLNDVTLDVGFNFTFNK